MARSVARLRPGLLGLALLVGCLDPTQATLLISTNVTCGPESAEPGALFETGILAAPASRVDEVSFTVTTKECSAGDVGSIVVFPEDGASEAAVVVVGSIGSQTAEGCLPFARRVPMADGNQCIVARRRISFISHKKLEIPIVLDMECVGVD